MTAKQWFAIDIVVSPAAADAAEEALAIVADLGTSLDGLRKHPGEPVSISGFFAEIPDVRDVRKSIENALNIHGVPLDAVMSIKSRTVNDADWLAEWKRHWRPVEIGPFVISPPWIEPERADKAVILIEPNMAFGTGTHETTQLCLEMIGELYTPDQSVLDVGTGTGILAIAAAKLGGTQITACDTDADSVNIARANAVLNAVADRIDLFDGSLDDATPAADLVCANLTIDVILPILPLLFEKTRRHLLLSGILAEQEQLITDALSDLKMEIYRKGEWIAVIVSFPAS